MTKRRLRTGALDRIFEQALLVGSATLLSGCCGIMSRMAPAYSGIRVVSVSEAEDPRLQRLVRESHTEGLEPEVCASYCGTEGLQGCSLAKLAVQRPEPLPEVRCEYASGPAELRSLLADAAAAGGKQPLDCSYICGYPGREVKSCSPVLAVAETDVLLCRFYEPPRCVTHIPSGRLPSGLGLEHWPAPTTAARYFAVAAYLEAASALAFDDLASQLTRHGAPFALVERCRRAARDERFHHRAFAALSGDELASLPFPELPVRAEPSLSELALENIADGCVVETYSALVIAYQARHAESPRLRGLLAKVARDERRHALLSWDISAWLQRRLVASEQARLAEQLRRARATLEAMVPRFSSELRAELGLPDVQAAKAMLRSLDVGLWRDGEGAISARTQASAVA